MPTLSTVLLVDDDPTTNFLHQLLLTHLGVAEQILVAENGEQALRQPALPPAYSAGSEHARA